MSRADNPNRIGNNIILYRGIIPAAATYTIYPSYAPIYYHYNISLSETI